MKKRGEGVAAAPMSAFAKAQGGAVGLNTTPLIQISPQERHRPNALRR
jgi:hypothetical protein